jgi:hypothetical protein
VKVETVIGVDFSGAKEAGRNIWLAEAGVAKGRLRLRKLENLEVLAGVSSRKETLAHLVDRIRASQKTLWAIDFPFALPIELTCMGCDFLTQLQTTLTYKSDAAEFGRWLLGEAKKLGGKNHIRRQTDSEAKTPFDCYHYRIIYQTFHGMRDVLQPLASDATTAILPFQYDRLPTAERVVIEACPSTTLKKLALPHQMYKQPGGGELTRKRLANRKLIMDGLEALLEVPPELRRVMARNPGGDAIDSALAAVGAWRCWRAIDHEVVAKHERYPREGYVYG